MSDRPASRIFVVAVEPLCLLAMALLSSATLLIVSADLTSPFGWQLMKASTALGMLLLVAGLVFSFAGTSSRMRMHAANACAGLILLLALVALLGWITGTGAASGRMSVQTALCFLLLGAMLPWIGVSRGNRSHMVDGLVLLFVAMLLMVLAGYLFGAISLFGPGGSSQMSVTSFICFVLAAWVVLWRRSAGGLFAVLRGEGIGSRIARIAIPAALLLPLAVSILRGYASSHGWLKPTDAGAIAVAFICLCISGLILLVSRRINVLEREVLSLEQQRSAAKLEESEQRYMELVEQAVTGFVVRRPDGQLVLVNDAYCRMTGYSREELLTLKARDMVVDQTVLEKVAQLKPGESTQIDTLMKCKGGEVKEVQYVTQRRRDGNLQSVLVDLSGRKRVERAREESERRYAELVDQALEGIMVRRPEGQILFVNDALCRMLGYTRQEMLGLTIRDLVHPEDVETIIQVQALESGGHLHLQKRMLCKDGRVIYVEVSAKRLREGDVQTTVHDVTERKRAADMARAAEHRYETAVNALAEGVAVLDREGRVVAFNKSAIKILAMSQDQFTGRMVQDPDWRLQREDGTPFPLEEHPVVITLSTGQDCDDVILVAALPDGTRRTLTVSSRGLEPDRDGKPTNVLASFRDITQQRQHEQRLRDYAEELRVMSQQLLEAQETERRAIARELHDEVGQSLTATRLNLRDLERQAEGGPFAARLGDTSNIVAELLGKVRQMSLDLHPSVLDDLGLGPAFRWMVRTRAGESGLALEFDLPADLPRFTGMTEITLFRVFQEALSNVLKHAGAAHLSVRVHYAGGKVEMTLKDDGRGFDAEAARRHALSGRSLGMVGMGERVRLAGGEIMVTSEPGRGAEIRVVLPAEERDVEGMPEYDWNKEWRPMRILIADDHTLVRAGLTSLIARLPEMEVVAEAADGRQALRLVRDLQPDMVLMDIAMPGLNGLEAAERIHNIHPQTKIIILSMHASEEYVAQALKAGASGYLLKDAATAELEMALKSVSMGQFYLSPAISRQVVDNFLRGGPTGLDLLTPRQREILQLIAEGKGTREIADTLHLSVKTVETHRAQLMERLDIHDVVGLVRYAMKKGLIPST